MNDFIPANDPPALPAPAPVRPLAYFDAPDDGWQAVTRLTLLFTAIYAAARLCAGLVYATMMLGRTGVTYAPPGPVLSIAPQILLPLAALTASLIAFGSRTRATRLGVVWCVLVMTAGGLILTTLSAMSMMQSGVLARLSMPLAARVAYILNPMASAIAGAVLPVFVIVLLTRPGALRCFGEMPAG